MKGLFLGLFLFFSFLARSQFSKAEIQVSGLTCSLCSKAVLKALEEVAFVKKVEVDIKNQQYEIFLKDNSTIDPDELKNAVSNAGFSVAKLKVSGYFSNLQLQKGNPIKIDNLFFLFLNSSGTAINGELTLTVIEKDYLTTKAFKKYCSDPSIKCMQTAVTTGNKRIYRVII